MQFRRLAWLSIALASCGGSGSPSGAIPLGQALDPTLPTCGGTELPKTDYTICHQDDWLIPEWVGYVLTAQDLEGTASRTDDYRPDPDLPVGHRAELSDYDGSALDRGHMAPAGDFTRNEEAMSETFFLSNMAPQEPSFNRGPWKDLEMYVRGLVTRAGQAKIFAGNLFLNGNGQPTDPQRRIGTDGVAVPTHCFKLLVARYDNGDAIGLAFLGANAYPGGDWRTFQTTIDDVETLTGLDFFDELPEDVSIQLEAAKPPLP